METSFQNIKTAAAYLAPFMVAELEHPHVQPRYMQCELMFGSPSSNCAGNGICKIIARGNQPSAIFQRTSCSHARALVGSAGDGNTVFLLFRRDWLCADLMRKHFRHGVLEMPEPCPVPAGLASVLGLRTGELPAGLHLIEDHGTYFRISICRHDT